MVFRIKQIGLSTRLKMLFSFKTTSRIDMTDGVYMVLPLNFFPLKIFNHGLFGRMKIIASRPNLEPVSKEQL